MKGNGVKVVIAVVVLLVAVFVYLKFATTVFDSAPRLGEGATPNAEGSTVGRKPKAE
ncbi:MAG: hypothetical protein ACKVZJ_05935 [Phycisphaerales bacterium]